MDNQIGGAVTNLLKDMFVSKIFTTDNIKSTKSTDNIEKTKTPISKVSKIQDKQTNVVNERVPIYQMAIDEPQKIKKIYSKPQKKQVAKINDDIKEYKLAYDVDYNAMVPIHLKK